MIWLALPAVAASCYYVLALFGALRVAVKRKNEPNFTPPVSILKPIRGRDPFFYNAILSHATQRYPLFEILFGVADPGDPALQDICRLQAEHPEIPIRIISTSNPTPNAKVGVLADLVPHAQHEILLVNDSDICVEPDYLCRAVAPLADPAVGLSTCLYRARGGSFPAIVEALGIATEFTPSVLVARLLGVAEFALGSTMAFRKRDLARIGGFAAIADYLADDYQLGARITKLGLSVAFADTVVQTNVGEATWRSIWNHQVRWSRTIRVSRPAGYYGYIATQATVWCLLAAMAGFGLLAGISLGLRVIVGILTSEFVLQDRRSLAYFWLIPLRDLFGFAVWLAGVTGDSVEWRGESLRLTTDGKLTRQ